MWKNISDKLKDYPERLAVARILVENGLSVRDERIWCNEIMVPVIRIAKAGASLREIARHLNFGVVEITPTNASIPGILASSASLMAERNISIRQAIVDDPELSPEPKLTLIAEKKIPGDLIPEFLKINGVDKVSIY